MKKLAELKPGDRFMYGGVEWVKFEDIGAGTLCLAAEPVFLRAFDEENCNDWRKSSLRRELNGAFLDALVAEGADRAAFLDWESDLTADDGMTDYGTATDKIALRSDALCRKYTVTMQTVIKASAFDRAMKLEAELNRIHGRIIKLLDSIKGYEMESRRLRLEERKYNLAKQKLSGAYDIDPETGEINDEAEEPDELEI